MKFVFVTFALCLVCFVASDKDMDPKTIADHINSFPGSAEDLKKEIATNACKHDPPSEAEGKAFVDGICLALGPKPKLTCDELKDTLKKAAEDCKKGKSQ